MNELVEIKDNEIVVQKEVVEKLKNFQKLKLQMDLMEKELRQGLKEAMEQMGKHDFAVDGLIIKYKDPFIRKSVDSTRLKKELPDVYESYLKETNVSGSVSLTFQSSEDDNNSDDDGTRYLVA